MEDAGGSTSIRILCRKLVIPNHDELQWLIGSPFFPAPTVASTFRCIHTLPSNPLSPDFSKESDDIRILLPKGFEVIGALIVRSDLDAEKSASEAIDAAVTLRKLLQSIGGGSCFGDRELVGAVVDLNSRSDVQFFLSRSGNTETIESVKSVIYENQPEKYILLRGCILRCELSIKLPVYYPVKNLKGAKFGAKQMWGEVTERMNKKLARWKKIHLTKREELLLYRVPYPIYLLTFFLYSPFL